MITVAIIISTLMTAILTAVVGMYKNGTPIKDVDPYQVLVTIIIAAGIGGFALLTGGTVDDTYMSAGLATAAQLGLTGLITDFLKGTGLLKRTTTPPAQ